MQAELGLPPYYRERGFHASLICWTTAAGREEARLLADETSRPTASVTVARQCGVLAAIAKPASKLEPGVTPGRWTLSKTTP